MPTTGNGGYASKYTDGAAVDKRLDQGYYDDIIAAGIAAGIYTAATAPSKAELDKKIAKNELYIFHYNNQTSVTQKEYDDLHNAVDNGIPILVEMPIAEQKVYYPAIGRWAPGFVEIAIFNVNRFNALVGALIQVNHDLSVINRSVYYPRTDDVLTKDNDLVFVPTRDYHPATKKYVDDNTLDSSLKETLDYMCKKATVTTLSGLPSDAANVIANVTSATNLTHSGLAEPRQQMIRVNNTTSSDITQALPTTGIYESMAGPSVVIPANNYIELSLWAINGKISIRVGEHA